MLRNNEDGEPIDPSILKAICEEVKKVYDIVEIGLVIGGGNIFRGLSGAEMKGVDRTWRLHGDARHCHQWPQL